jgi:hypothetical protein
MRLAGVAVVEDGSSAIWLLFEHLKQECSVLIHRTET